LADVAVVGGGITGLAAAYFLHQRAPELSVTVLESDDRLGGKIRTEEWMGVPVEAGPDTFLARGQEAVDLCRSLDLGDDLVAPATGRAYIWTRGRLRPLPEGHLLGVPGRLWPLARTGLVPPAAVLRAALDLVLPRQRHGPDPSVTEVVGARFGREVAIRVVDPLLGGICAGSTDRLSLAAVARPVADAAARSRSLLLGLRRAQAPEGPVFHGIRGGLQRLVDRLRQRLDGVDVRLGTAVEALDRDAGHGRWQLRCSTGPPVEASTVILTVPAYAAADIVKPISSGAGEELAGIPYASVVTVTLAYRPDDVIRPLDGSGFLVPAVDGRLLTACTWMTSKWPHLARSGRVLLRVSAGRAGDERAFRLADDELVQRLHAELDEALGLRAGPEGSVVTHWPRSFPQYDVGHAARVAAAEQALEREAPGVILAGAAYRGLGIAACIAQAKAAAARVSAAPT
jgi:oxygen-dependent protoporphyrinogen oxidase